MLPHSTTINPSSVTEDNEKGIFFFLKSLLLVYFNPKALVASYVDDHLG